MPSTVNFNGSRRSRRVAVFGSRSSSRVGDCVRVHRGGRVPTRLQLNSDGRKVRRCASGRERNEARWLVGSQSSGHVQRGPLVPGACRTVVGASIQKSLHDGDTVHRLRA